MNKRKKLKKIFLMVIIVATFVMSMVIYMIKTKPYLSDKEITIYTGYTKTIYLKGRYTKSSWQSDDNEIACVEDGKITGKNAGTTVIRVETKNKTFNCKVNVLESLSPKYYEFAKQEKEWVLSNQLDNGAICNRLSEKGVVSINPYFASNAMINILEINDPEDYLPVKKYIEWHFNHINKDEDYNGLKGTIYDYHARVDGLKVLEEESLEKYDSTDSYAAMFIILLRKYVEKTNDIEMLNMHIEEIGLVANSMLYTLEDGYTYCKPDYKIKYLMDNAEVLTAMDSLTWICKKINSEYTNQIEDAGKEMTKHFENIWWRGEHYSPYLGENNRDKDEEFSWDTFYADATSQLATVIYEVGTTEHQNQVYKKFCENWKFEELDYYIDGEADFYWGEILYASAVMKDDTRAKKYIEKYCELSEDRKYPLIVSDCSWVARGSYKLAKYYEDIEKSYAD